MSEANGNGIASAVEVVRGLVEERDRLAARVAEIDTTLSTLRGALGSPARTVASGDLHPDRIPARVMALMADGQERSPGDVAAALGIGCLPAGVAMRRLMLKGRLSHPRRAVYASVAKPAAGALDS